jgi:uncharacterized protein YkwD
MKFFRKHFTPNAQNKFHPHPTRYYALVAYSLLFFAINFFVFPSMNLSTSNVLASNIDTDELISLANKERSARGLENLQKNPDLARAALAKGKDMLQKQYWNHFGPNGETPWQFIKGAGYSYIYAGENLAKDFSTTLETHLAWMNSSSHKANILNANYREVGIAIVSGTMNSKTTTIVVEVFGSKESSNKPKPQQQAQPAQQEVPKESAIKSYKPQINKPEENSIFGTNNIKLIGESNYGELIKVYSNDKLIGELPKNDNNFIVDISLIEGENNLYIQSKDKANDDESLTSDKRLITIDKTAVDIDRIHIELFTAGQESIVLVRPEEAVATMDFVINNQVFKMNQKDTDFYFKFDPKKIERFKLVLYDEVGNVSTKEIDLLEYEQKKDGLPAYLNITTNSGQNDFLSTTVAKFGARETVNFFFVTIFFIIIVADAFFVFKRGHIREWASHHAFHIALLLIITFGMMTI